LWLRSGKEASRVAGWRVVVAVGKKPRVWLAGGLWLRSGNDAGGFAVAWGDGAWVRRKEAFR
jgi:hypothetical protein